jgi:hypothetical protein
LDPIRSASRTFGARANGPAAISWRCLQHSGSLAAARLRAEARKKSANWLSLACTPSIPGVRRIALLGNIANPFNAFSWNEIQPAGPSLGLELRLFTISELGELPATFAAIKGNGSDALFVLSDALFNAARQEIARLAAQHRLPSMFEAREFVEAGGLLAYGLQK